jgi:hypothetical protein
MLFQEMRVGLRNRFDPLSRKAPGLFSYCKGALETGEMQAKLVVGEPEQALRRTRDLEYVSGAHRPRPD